MRNLAVTLILFFLLSSFKLHDTIPPLNQKIVTYVNSVIGQQVGRGECWDLASAALDYSGAYLDRRTQKTIYIFGKKLNPERDIIYPGDIIQFEDVSMEYQKDNVIYKESMPHHTAIVYQVLDKGHYQLAHQNTAFSGKKVGLSELKLSNIKKGKLIFYRPIPDK